MSSIAIIGIGCRFPGGGNDPESLWEMLLQKTDAIRKVPENRWDLRRFFDKDRSTPGKMYQDEGGFLESPIDQFDPAFFRISPREAQAMDPQERLLLEVTWEAFEDGGVNLSHLKKTGIFIGGFTTDWQVLQNHPSNLKLGGSHTAVNAPLTILSARLAHAFNLIGPCLTVDTACSSSLVSCHLACQALKNGECDTAIAGGVNLIFTPETSIAMSKANFLSPTSRCRSFSGDCDGYVRGEGAAVIILKPLNKAIKDNDKIYAVIRGTGINHDGNTKTLTFPNQYSQKELIKEVLTVSGVEPEQIQYVEAHGTGTPAGDPVEAWALNEVYQCKSRKKTCLLGSIKTNIGHLEAAAGIAGLIKGAMCLKKRKVPPNLHFKNPKIPFEKTCLKVPTKIETLKEKKNYASVNSFGYGGTNAHVILEEYQVKKSKKRKNFFFYPISAGSEKALEERIDQIKQNDHPIADLQYTLCTRRNHLEYRAYAINQEDEFVTGTAKPRKIAFVFSGMGPQYEGMGKGLIDEEKCGKSKQLTNFHLQEAIGKNLKKWGINPEGVVGHSVGDISAAYFSGAISRKQALEITYNRERVQEKRAGLGKMLAVGISADEAKKYCSNDVSIAAINSPKSVTLSGSEKSLEKITESLGEVFFRFLSVDIAYHSHQMDGLKEDFIQSIGKITPKPFKIPYYSTVGPKLKLNTEYWWQNIRKPVRFAQAIEEMVADGFNCFIEIGAHPALKYNLKECLKKTDAVVITTLHREKENIEALKQCLGNLYIHGVEPDWKVSGHLISLPNYPWQKESFWTESDQSKEYRISNSKHPFLRQKIPHSTTTWNVEVNSHFFPWLNGHRIENTVVFPAAGYIEAALEIHHEKTQKPTCTIEEIEFSRPLTINTEPILEMSYKNNRFEIHSEKNGEWTKHASGKFWEKEKKERDQFEKPILKKCTEDIYEKFGKIGLHYRHEFKGIKELWIGNGCVVTKIENPDEKTILHPAVLDCAFQSLIGVMEEKFELIVPYKIQTIHYYSKPQKNVWCYGTSKGDLILFDDDGTVHIEVIGIKFKALPKENHIKVFEVDSHIGFIPIDKMVEEALDILNGKTTASDPLKPFCRVIKNEKIEIDCPLDTKTRLIPKTFEPQFKEISPSKISVKMDHKLQFFKNSNSNEEGLQIAVAASSLNFKDVMKAHGRLDETVLNNTYFGNEIGMECSGTVVSEGKKYSVGDQVCAFVPGTFCSRLTVSENYVFPILPGTTLETAPQYIPFITVLHALKHMAKLRKKEKILIHSAAGAVGLAAIQYAKHIGAEIYATAGSHEKRHYLRMLGIKNIENSRNLDFLEMFSEGVDVVLNSLAGEMLMKSWEAIRPYGRFIEIGKYDISLNSGLSMAPFNRNATFIGIDLDRMLIDDQRQIQKLMKECFQFFEKGIFQPLPTKIFPASKVSDAFKLMARAKHIGKISVSFQNTTVPVVKTPVFDGTHLITGGMRGLGLEVAKWLVKKGAKHLILLGRKKRNITIEGAKVETMSCDVGNYESLKKVIERVGPNLKGVFHLAMVLDDKWIKDMTKESIENVVHPKASGAWNLHLLTKNLDYFVMFSSISSLIGTPGQGNYVLANSFLDQLVNHRRKMNLPGISLNLGAIEGVGVVARNIEIKKQLDLMGIRGIPVEKVLEYLGKILIEDSKQIAIVNADLKKIKHLNPTLIGDLVQDKKEKSFLLEMDEEHRQEYLLRILKETASKILETKDFTPDTPLNNIGFDSLMALEFQQEAEEKLGIEIETMKMMEGTTLRAIGNIILESLQKSSEESMEKGNTIPSQSVENKDEVSNDEEPLPTETVSDIS